MSGIAIISSLNTGSSFIPTIGDGPNTSTIGSAGENMRDGGTGMKAIGSKYTKDLAAAGLE